MASAERVSIGFSGGQVVEVKLDNGGLKDLRKALEKADGWLDLDASYTHIFVDDSTVRLRASSATDFRGNLDASYDSSIDLLAISAKITF